MQIFPQPDYKRKSSQYSFKLTNKQLLFIFYLRYLKNIRQIEAEVLYIKVQIPKEDLYRKHLSYCYFWYDPVNDKKEMENLICKGMNNYSSGRPYRVLQIEEEHLLHSKRHNSNQI